MSMNRDGFNGGQGCHCPACPAKMSCQKNAGHLAGHLAGRLARHFGRTLERHVWVI